MELDNLKKQLNELKRLRDALEEHFPEAKRLREIAKDLPGVKEIADGSQESEMSDSLNLIYVVKQGRILTAAEKMAKGIGEYRENSLECMQKISVPEIKKGLQLGDNVRIKYQLVEFKAIQKQTTGWDSDFGFLVNETGFITETRGELSPSVRVCFPTKNKSITLHASVLEKISSPAYTRPVFKPNDTVVVNSNREVVSLLQRSLGDLPNKLVGKRGKVVGVSMPAIFVRFDGPNVWAVRPAVLKRLDEECTPLKEEERSFKIGEKVKLIGNVKKLIKQQVGHGGWDPEMSFMMDKELVIVQSVKKDTIRVIEPNGRLWHVNEKSIIRSDKTSPEDKDEDLPFKLKQKVKVQFSNMAKIMNNRQIPLEFLEFLQCPAVVRVYNDDLKAGISFNSEQNIVVTTDILRAASDKEIERAEEVQAAVEAFEAGSEVCLDVGPVNFVLRVLQSAGVSGKIVKAMTTVAKILGFDGPYHVVIVYPNGDKFRIHKKYLTDPRKFKIHEVEQDFQPEAIPEIKFMIVECLESLPKGGNTKAQKVKFISAQQGIPPILRFSIRSFTATLSAIVGELKKRCVITELADAGVYEAKGFQSYDGAVILQLLLNDEGHLPMYKEPEQKPTPSTESVSETPSIMTGGPTQEPIKAEREMQPPVGDTGTAEAPPPVGVVGSGRFRYMRLIEPSLGRVVLVPYVLGDRIMREGAEPVQQQHQQQSSGVNVNAGQGTTVNIYP